MNRRPTAQDFVNLVNATKSGDVSADEKNRYGSENKKIGRLTIETILTIKTRQAQQLAIGRNKSDKQPPIVGLFRFGKMTVHLWQRAQADDPFADWTLLRIEEGVKEGRQHLKQIGEQMRTLLGSIEGLHFEVADNAEPLDLKLMFSTAYGYQAAQLLYEFDETMRAVLTVRHVGLLNRDVIDRTVYQAGHVVRSLFMLPARWVDRTQPAMPGGPIPMLPGCTRQDVRESTPAAALMRERLGELPPGIADGSTRPQFAPVALP